MNSKKKNAKATVWRPTMGPGFIVAAAFVGPGTVIAATEAGAQFGLQLVWVVGFSVLAAIILQEMATRLGTLTGIGLGELLRRQFSTRPATILLSALVILAIGAGNAAYQTGNLTGATLGIANLIPLQSVPIILIISLLASGLLWFGSYKIVERVLVAAVALMGLAFVVAAIIVVISKPLAWSETIPNFPANSLTTILALIGTTLVPYNLFLHASTSSRRWAPIRPRDFGLRSARLDSALGITAGGLVTLSILIASAAVQQNSNADPASMADSLKIVVGNQYAPLLFFLGVAAAGLTSAITAPLAAAYAVCGILGWSSETKSPKFRAVWGTVMGCGVLASLLLGSSPKQTIIIAQAANAIALPVIGGILLLACNAKLLSKFANTTTQNIAGGAVVLFVALLSLYKLGTLFASLLPTD